jgi:hypothetical protein
MERAGPLSSQINCLAVFIGGLVLAACARSAPPLPAAYSGSSSQIQLNGEEQNLTCVAIDNRIAAKNQRTQELESIIQGNRKENQTIGFVAGLVLPPLALAAEGNSKEKKELDGLQAERDRLYTVRRAKNCA